VSGFEIVRSDELDSIPVSEGLVWHPVRRRLGIRAFGINLYTAEAVGGHVVERHTEESLGHEEVYFVVAGRARFTLGGEDVDAPAGTFVFVSDPAIRREAVALEEGTTVVAVGGKAGEAYSPSAWESWFSASPYDDAGDHARAADVMLEDFELHQRNPRYLYHLAEQEAKAGRHEDAATHLRTALDLHPELRDRARDNDAFTDSVYQSLVSPGDTPVKED
jgi:hypothetical protein